ncbi:MAG: zf-HC2 domain-containing protein [Pyrinomonadaceae bacterium]
MNTEETNCGDAEKVSLLIDGELSEAESRRTRAHIAGCPKCADLEKDFLFFREQIKASAIDNVVEPLKAPVISPEKETSVWRRGIRLPVPVFAVLILIVVGAGALLIASILNKRERAVAVENSAQSSPSKIEKPSGEISIARFDQGGRTEIYVAPRVEKEVRK